MKFLSFTLVFVLILSCLSIASAMASETMTAYGDRYLYHDGWIYYRLADENGNQSLNKMRNDGSDAQKLLDVSFHHLAIANDVLYFLNEEGINRVNVDGSNPILLDAENGSVEVSTTGDFVYVRTDKIIRYSTDPWEKVGEIEVPDFLVGHYLIDDGWVYTVEMDYDTSHETHDIYGFHFIKSSVDGSNRETWFSIPGDYPLSMWTIYDGKLYYALDNPEKGFAQLKSADLDGTNDTLILEGLRVSFIDDDWAYGVRYADEPTVTPADESFSDKEYTNFDLVGFYRTNLTTGESVLLSNEVDYSTIPLGDWILFDIEGGWGDGAQTLVKKDGSVEITLPIPIK